ncbi:MAG TPA: acyltransferase family protein [Daejeonella sp.]|nr:acyltransferase family protein [Daejeonella sp.]
MNQIQSLRLFYLDWLRVSAFAILIIANSFEVFTQHSWWIKNSETNIVIDHILIFFRQWRMPLLFLISGAAVALILKKRTAIQFIDDRFIRILVPLIAGMLLIIPPQIYFIWKFEGYTQTFGQFYLDLLDFKWFPQGNFHWLHLWYLAFIFIFSISVLPLMFLLRLWKIKTLLDHTATYICTPYILFPVMMILQIPYFTATLVNLNDNLTSLIYYFPYFLFGFLFLTQQAISQAILKYRWLALALGMITSLALYVIFWMANDTQGYIDLGFSQDTSYLSLRLLLTSLNNWFWAICLIGFAHRYLNFGHSALNYANKVVYPFYIFHQTVIIILAYYVIRLNISAFFKFNLIFGGTFLSIWLLYELVLKRSGMTKLMFGIKTDIRIKPLEGLFQREARRQSA